MKLQLLQHPIVPPLIRHAGEGRHPGGGRGWIPAFAGMTEPSCQFVARILPAHVFSKESTKDTKGSDNDYSDLRALRVLRGDVSLPNSVTSAISAVNTPFRNFFGCVFAALGLRGDRPSRTKIFSIISAPGQFSRRRAIGKDHGVVPLNPSCGN